MFYSLAKILIGVPGDVRVEEKEEEKVTKYQYFAHEVKRLWQLKSVRVIPVVVGALGTIPRKLELYVEKGGIEVSVGVLQNTFRIPSEYLGVSA